MDLTTVRKSMETAFEQDLLDGTIEIRQNERSMILDGGNWSLAVQQDGSINLVLPGTDPNYFASETEAFLDNVFSIEVEQSLGILDRALDGAILRGLSTSSSPWSRVMESRIASVASD